jgi:hypothetical protein
MKKIPDERLYKEYIIKDINDIIQENYETDLDDFIEKIQKLKSYKSDVINLFIRVESDYDYTSFSLVGFKRKTEKEIQEYDEIERKKAEKKALAKEKKKANLLKQLEELEKEE